jgi:hypothetical protein
MLLRRQLTPHTLGFACRAGSLINSAGSISNTVASLAMISNPVLASTSIAVLKLPNAVRPAR